MIGRRVGPYRLVRELGRGGMGAVYLGIREDGEFQMKVSVKLLRQELASTGMEERFRQERQVLADLKHPHIATLLDGGTTEDGFLYLIMEYIDGQHIDAWCASNPDLSTILRQVRTLALALGHAHRTGIIHCDIKPHNIMVTREGEPKLLDFGIAQLARRDDGNLNEFLMTPAYAAPEQRKGQKATGRTDIYSLGIVLLQLLTGQSPIHWPSLNQAIDALMTGAWKHQFHTDNQETKRVPEQATRVKKVDTQQTTAPIDQKHNNPPSNNVKGCVPDRDGQSLPEALGYVLRRSLAENPRHRFVNMDELVSGLDRVIASLPREKTSIRTEKRFDVFLWHHPTDRQTVRILSTCLKEQGLRIWDERREGDYSPRAMNDILTRVHACIICLGPGGAEQNNSSRLVTPWEHDPSMRDSLAFHSDELHLFPLLLPGAGFPERQSRLPGFLRGLAWRSCEDGLDEATLSVIAREIKGTRRQREPLPEGICPFRGLEVFREEDAHLFFGRESVVWRITRYLADHAFIAVLGPSGSGKSSVVQAGVLPWIREQNRAVILFSPGQHPLEALAFLVPGTAGEDSGRRDYLRQRMSTSVDALYFQVRAYLDQTGEAGICLVIDQFEEIFTLTTDDDERNAFIGNLIHALDQPGNHISILLTMRSDFLGHCIAYPDLNAYISDHLIQVEPMNREELTRAVVEPAWLAGLTPEPGLLERILNDVMDAVCELPLLEHALLELYKRRKAGMLTQAAYNEIGGIEGALARSAEREFTALNEAGQMILRKMFVLCLVKPGEGTEDTRRRATRDALLAVGGSSDQGNALLQRWTEVRLLSGSHDPVRGLEMVDIAHEALIRRWVRVGEWMAEDRETARLLNRLRQMARAWHDSGRDDDHLLRGGPLYQMKELVDRESDHLEALELDFVSMGMARLEAVQRRGRLRRNIALAAAILGGFLAVIASLMYFRANEAQQRAVTARARAEWATRQAETKNRESNYNLAMMFNEKAGIALGEQNAREGLLYALAALSRDIPDDRSRSEVLGHFSDPALSDASRLLWTSPVSGPVTGLVFSPRPLPSGEALLAMAFNDHRIRLINMRSGQQVGLITGHGVPVDALAFSNDGRFLASAGSDFVRLWALQESGYPEGGQIQLSNRPGTVCGLAFSADDRLLAIASLEGTATVYRLLENGEPEVFRVDRQQNFSCLAFSEKGDELALGNQQGMTLRIALETGRQETIRGEHPVQSLCYLGQDLAIIYQDGSILNTTTGKSVKVEAAVQVTRLDGDLLIRDEHNRLTRLRGEIQVLTDETSKPSRNGYLSVGPDGTIAFGPTFGLPQFIDEQGRSRAQSEGHSGPVSRLSYSADGRYLASASMDEGVRVWDMKTRRCVTVLGGNVGGANTPVFSGDGRLLAVSAGDGNIRIWNTDGFQFITRLEGHENAVNSITFSPNNRFLVSGSRDQRVRIWRIREEHGVSTFVPEEPLSGHENTVVDVDVSPDGTLLASASADHTVVIWDAETRRPLAELRHPAIVLGLDFSPDGRMLATAASDYSVRLWRLPDNLTGTLLRLGTAEELIGHSSYVCSVRFSPDGSMLVSAAADGQLKLWEVERRKTIRTLTAGDTHAFDAVFAPDGKTVASSSSNHQIRLWDIEKVVSNRALVGHSDHVRSVSFSRTGQVLASASADRTVRLWDVRLRDPLAVLSLSSYAWDVAFSPDDALLAIAGGNPRSELWLVEPLLSQDHNENVPIVKQPAAFLEGHKTYITCVDFSPDGRLVATGAGDQTIRLWPVPNRETLLFGRREKKSIKLKPMSTLTGHDGFVSDLAFAPDGTVLASASQDATVRIWNVAKGDTVTVLRNHSAAVQSVAFSPDGRVLASSGTDLSIKLWDGQSYEFMADLNGHTDRITRLAFSPDSDVLASASSDQTIRLWDISTLRPIAAIGGHRSQVYGLDFCEKTGLLAAGDSRNTVRFWQTRDLAFFRFNQLDQADYQRLFRRALAHFGYYLDGFKLATEQRIALVPLGEASRQHEDTNLLRPRRPNQSLIDWLAEESR